MSAIDSGERLARLALYLSLKLNAAAFHRIMRVAGGAEEAWSADLSAFGFNGAPLLRGGRFEEAVLEMERAEKAGLDIIVLGDDNYPLRVAETPDPPPVLWLRGRLAIEDQWALALVGSRQAGPEGLKAAYKLARDAAAAGLTVVSGLAKGVDAAAHRGALDAGGRTLAVMGCGLSHIYPAENRALAQAAAEQGALVSEFPVLMRPAPANFPRRNRVIAALSLAVLVVEAPERSGALITARLAAEMGREVMALPGPAGSPRNQGSHRLIKNGAALVESLDEILVEIKPRLLEGLSSREMKPVNSAEAPDEEEAADIAKIEAAQPKVAEIKSDDPDGAAKIKILERLRDGPAHPDDLIRALGFSAPLLAELLLNLELEGEVIRRPSGAYSI